MSGTADELARLAAWIDERLGDETADRQYIAEQASARVKDVALQMMGAEELARARARRVGGAPLETERQARELPAVQAVYEAFDADPGPGKMVPHNLRMLLDAVGAAGVRIGAYDVRILEWLAGWEPATCAVIAGLITRAAQRRDGLEYDAGLRAMNQAIEAAVRAYFEALGIVPPGDAQ